ncbi:hypothetical protein, contains CCCH-type Zn-finger [Trachipleistophora hominis]|uniref:Uncharacterized protein n=1 Tax=Trachipleistophora hominis TaxID=72359 RepID=L7JYG1_TRAHO|nr:hypothetical protein, contains CCCH-type Zn-finger [Trachipleistophora hominis]
MFKSTAQFIKNWPSPSTMPKKKQDAQPKAKKDVKSTKEMKKELEEKFYGQKQSKALRAQLKKLDLLEKVQKKEQQERQKEREAEHNTRPVKPVVQASQEVVDQPVKSIMVCRYLVDALHNKSYSKGWICPERCGDVHVIDEKQNIEEFLEMQRASVASERLLSKEEYDKFVDRREKEEMVFERRRERIKSGYEMFRDDPTMFEDVDGLS